MLEEKNGWYRVKGDMRLQGDMFKYRTSMFMNIIYGGVSISIIYGGILGLRSNVFFGLFVLCVSLCFGVLGGSLVCRGMWENKKIRECDFYVCTVLVLGQCIGYGGQFIDAEINGKIQNFRCRGGNKKIKKGDTITLVKIDYTKSPVKILDYKEIFVLDGVYPEYQKEQKKLEKKS